DHMHPERAAQLDEPLEQVRRIERFDHDRDLLVTNGRDPEPRPLPSAEVRQGDDHALAVGEPDVEVLESLVRHAGVELFGARAGRVRSLRGRGTRRDRHRADAAGGFAVVAWPHTRTKRCTAVNDVSTTMTHRRGMSSPSNKSPSPSTPMRSARSMRPPRASKPSDSALARSYEISIDRAMTARGNMPMWPPSWSSRYHATPPSSRA